MSPLFFSANLLFLSLLLFSRMWWPEAASLFLYGISAVRPCSMWDWELLGLSIDTEIRVSCGLVMISSAFYQCILISEILRTLCVYGADCRGRFWSPAFHQILRWASNAGTSCMDDFMTCTGTPLVSVFFENYSHNRTPLTCKIDLGDLTSKFTGL